MAEIADLLEKLKQLDEPTYEKIARGIPLQPCGQYMVFDHGEVRACQYHEAYMPFGDLLPEVAEAWLQFCIQQAITTKRWESEIIINPRNDDGKIIYLAFVTPRQQVKCYPHLGLGTIMPLGDDGSIMQWRDGCKRGCYGDSQAHALLSAYIACLESRP